MWHSEDWTHDGMRHGLMAWTHDGWHWLFGFHGLLSLVFLAVIVFAIVALVRDRRREKDGIGPPSADTPPGRRHEHTMADRRRPRRPALAGMPLRGHQAPRRKR